MTFIDWFAGIGGFRRGMELAGHKCVGFCEFDKYATASYTIMHLATPEQIEFIKTLSQRQRLKEILKEEYRNGEWYANDVRRVNSSDIPGADCWCFGFPCQDVSVAGKGAGVHEGTRSGLFYEIMRLLKGLRAEDRPKYLFIENVKNLLSIGRGFDFLRIVLAVESLGYDLQWQVLNSKDFGVPQNRERVFIVASLGTGRGRKIFPLRRASQENPVELKVLTPGVGQGARVYATDGLACKRAGEGGGGGAKTGLYPVETRGDRIKEVDCCNTIDANYGKGLLCNSSDPTSRGRVGVMECVGIIDDQGRKPNQTKPNQTILPDSKSTGSRELTQGGTEYMACLTPERERIRQNGRRIKDDGEPMFTLTAQDIHGVVIKHDPDICEQSQDR